MGMETKTVVFPAGAFALGIVLFSRDMREAFTAGILLIFASVLAFFLKNILCQLLPSWSVRGCLWIGAGSITAAAFELSFYALGLERTPVLFIMEAVIGLLAGEETYSGGESGDVNDLMWECSIVWALWIAVGTVREFMASGTVFLYPLTVLELASASFQKTMFAFVAAGVVLAVSCLILGKFCRGSCGLSWLVVICAVIYNRPYNIELFGVTVGAVLSAAVTLIFFSSVKKQQEGTLRRKALSGIPAEMIAMGIIYMILGMY